MRTALLLGSTLGLCMTMNLAHAASTADSPNIDSLKYFEGDWHCAPTGDDAAAKPGDLAVVNTTRHGGDWFVTHVTTFQAGHKAHKIWSKMTYNPGKKIFVEFSFCDSGSYGSATAEGWDGDVLSFVGTKVTKDGNDHFYRKTFKKVSDTSFDMLAEFSEDGKEYKVAHQAVCER